MSDDRNWPELIRQEWKNVPNFLTMVRIAATPVLFLMLLGVGHFSGAVLAAVYAFAAVTDLIDGWWARKFNQKTRLGKLIDPIADKLLVAAAGFGLLYTRGDDPWVLIPLGFILAREIAIATLVEAYRWQGLTLSVTMAGKIKTVAQGVAFILVILELNGTALWAGRLAMIVAVVLTVTSGVGYFRRAYAMRTVRD